METQMREDTEAEKQKTYYEYTRKIVNITGGR